MIANPKWFSPRKYGGWGINPNCWQGWVYLLVVMTPIILIPQVPYLAKIGTPLMLVWGGIFALDFVLVMVRMKKDERETIHEAIAERNAMWFMVTALATGIAFQAAKSAVAQDFKVDPVIIIALAGATVVKAISHWWLRDK